MGNVGFARRVSLWLVLAVGACSSEGVNCPEPTLERADLIANSTYRSFHDEDGTSQTRAFPSFMNSAPKALEVDRAAGVVRIIYLFEGEQVVETWEIKRRFAQ